MATTLQLSDGVTTLDLNDGISYGLLKGWIPRVARRSAGLLGGRSLYGPVTESIPIRVMGSTAAGALAALGDLAEMLDRVQRWADRDPTIAPWILTYQPDGSTLSQPLTALVESAAPSGDLLSLPATFNEYLKGFEINPVIMTLTRRGLWLTSEATATAAAADNPAVLSASFGARLDIAGPTAIRLTGISAGTDLMDTGYVLVSDADPQSLYGENFAIYDATLLSLSGASLVADAGALAVGGSVARLDAETSQTATLTIPSVEADQRIIYLFAAARNNHASTTWRIRPKSTGYADTIGRWQTIDATTTDPRILSLGLLAGSAPSHINVTVELETAASVGTLDINYIAVFPGGGYGQIVKINAGDYGAAAYARQLVIDHRSLTHLDPIAGVETE